METPQVTEWVGECGGDVLVPADKRATQQFRFTAYLPGGALLMGTCKYYQHVAAQSVTTLEDALCDTSERAHGIVLKPRVTWHHRIDLINVAIILLPLLKTDERNALPNG